MNTIIEMIDGLENSNEIIQAIKIYLNQNKKYTNVTLIGPEKFMATIKDEKNVKTIFTDKEEDSLKNALKFVNEKDCSFIFFSDYQKVISAAVKNKVEYLNKNKVLYAMNKFTLPEMGQFTYLVNTLNTNEETNDDFKEIVTITTDYLTKHSKGKAKTFKFLSSFTQDKRTDEIIKAFKGSDSFKGTISTSELINPNCDFILSTYENNAAFLEGFKFAFKVSDDLYKKETSLNFLTKLGNSLTKNARKTVNLRFDKKTRSYGTILLGFKTPFVLVNKDADLNQVLAALNTSKY